MENTSWREKFDAKFVIDENSVEFTDDGKSMKMAEDTRLIADYVDGNAVTAAHIKDFFTSELTSLISQLEGDMKEIIEEDGIVDDIVANDYNRGYNAGKLAAITLIKQRYLGDPIKN